jgi:hypothetical protein
MLRARSYLGQPGRTHQRPRLGRRGAGKILPEGLSKSAQPVRLHSAPPAPKASISCGRMTTFDGSSVAFCVRSLFRCLPRIGRSLCRARSRLSEDLADRPRAARPHPRRVATDRGAVSRRPMLVRRLTLQPCLPRPAKEPPGRAAHWLKIKNQAAPAVKREAEEDWGTKRWARGRKTTNR